MAELAQQLRVSTMTVYRLVQSGQLPATRVGRSYRIREEDVDVCVERLFAAQPLCRVDEHLAETNRTLPNVLYSSAKVRDRRNCRFRKKQSRYEAEV